MGCNTVMVGQGFIQVKSPLPSRDFVMVIKSDCKLAKLKHIAAGGWADRAEAIPRGSARLNGSQSFTVHCSGQGVDFLSFECPAWFLFSLSCSANPFPGGNKATRVTTQICLGVAVGRQAADAVPCLALLPPPATFSPSHALHTQNAAGAWLEPTAPVCHRRRASMVPATPCRLPPLPGPIIKLECCLPKRLARSCHLS